MNTPESTLFNAVPVVSELNRVAGFDPLRFLKKTANGHELDLRYKKLWFRLKYPAGRTRLTPLRITDQLAIIEAKVFFDKDDADPASSYIATMTQENAPAGLYIQAAEHDALDMALTNAGFGVQFAPMPKADTPYAEPITPVMRSEPAPAPQAAAEQVRTEPAVVRADIEPVVVQQPEQEVVHHAEKAVPDTAPVEVSAEQPAEAVVEPVVETELPFVYDEPSAASYARKLAENINQCNLIDARVPSILIAGGSNFPVRKKEKQNAARDKNMGEYMQIEGLLDKVRSTGMGGISADDDRAVEKLEAKLAGLEAMQEEMKTVNAYYRKHITLEGCPVLSAEEIGKFQSSMASDWRKNPVPYPSYLLTNNNANIRRTRQRIEDLKSQSEYAGWAFPGGRAEINEGENRLQLFFEEKPSEEQRRELKSNGFKWAPSQGAWQRQLTKNAIYAAGRMEFLRPEDGQSPYQLQPFARKTEKDMTR